MPSDDDAMYFAWVLSLHSRVGRPNFVPVVFREGIAKSALTHVYAKWKLRRHEQWMSLDELAARFPLKAISL